MSAVAKIARKIPLREIAEARLVSSPLIEVTERPVVKGKFLFVGEEKLWVKGVTYGTFHPDENGSEYHDPVQVAADFAAMATNGINTVRTYTVPPRWLLDIAQRHGLRVMIGLPWEQHVTFLDEPGRARAIKVRLREQVRICAGHPAILCYAIGNEIPSPIARWYGRRQIERFLYRLYRAVKEIDPTALATYVNFPTTEYLQLPFIDLVCFNVYLESREQLQAYLARLQNLAGERPLLLAELGLDSLRHGESTQADSLAWQIETTFAAGCAGTFVFAWTNEWYRGGYDIEDWDFGLVTRQRKPKPALATVRQAFTEVPFPPAIKWPRISVVVCSYNGARTIRDTLEGLRRLDYPDYEVIVINDGSTDRTLDIAKEYGVRLISTANRGLSNARNTGWQTATGKIVAYIDDDAYPDPHWLQYLAHTFMTTDYVGVGGPNIAPPGDGPTADCVANAPGGPVHVLISDTEAEHIPGCNMAYRRSALQTVGGFDPRYRTAGDDVDICWRLQEAGETLGFHAAAMVWHHRRNCVRMYWKQQQDYGKAEALLEEKWPEKYNSFGHLAWTGRLYGKGLTEVLSRRWRVYHGTWGCALFQSLYQPAPKVLLSLPLMPEWCLLLASLAILSSLGLIWKPMAIALPLFLLVGILPLVQAVLSARRACFTSQPKTLGQRLKLYAITAFLHLLHPVARLVGRLRHGLMPWRRRGMQTMALPVPRTLSVWRENAEAPEATLAQLCAVLRKRGAIMAQGGDYDRWDLAVRGGLSGGARLRMAIEEHGAGRQMVRLRIWPYVAGPMPGLAVGVAVLSLFAIADEAWLASGLLGTIAFVIGLAGYRDCAWASGTLSTIFKTAESAKTEHLR